MTSKQRLAVAGMIVVLVLASGIGGTRWFWQKNMIDIPPVIVYKAGQVAGMFDVRGVMDVQLPTKFHRQEHSLSCEIATLKMALQTVGVNIPESDLIAQLPFDTTPKSRGVWGDPNKGFVGDIDGKMLVDGYGVYWEPIAKVGLRYKRTEVISGGSAKDVAQHLAAGRPVIVWGNYGRTKKYSWSASDGSLVDAVNGEHTRIVTGFSGSANNPTSFSLIDPLYGPMTWSASKFMANWGLLGNKAVVVYPHPKWIRQTNSGQIWEVSKDGLSRSWVTSWEVFVRRGGYKEAVVEITPSELNGYKRGADIVLD